MQLKKLNALLVVIGLFLPAASVLAAEISNGYKVDKPLAIGTVVKIDTQQGEKVQPANIENLDYLFGVVAAKDESVIEISDSQDTAQVVTSGIARVLVTAHDGEIREGNFVTPVSLSGIASVAGRENFVLGVAKESFDGTGNKVVGTLEELTGFSSPEIPGNTPIGLINVEINVVGNPNLHLDAIQAIGKYFADRGIGPLKFILAFVIFITTLDVVGTVLFGSTKGGILSIGRNPLAVNKIYKSLAEVSSFSLGILALALVAMYFLLR